MELIKKGNRILKNLYLNSENDIIKIDYVKVTKSGVAIFRNYGTKYIDKELETESFKRAEAIINSAINIDNKIIEGIEDINDRPISEIVKDKNSLSDVTEEMGLAFSYQQNFTDITDNNLEKIFNHSIKSREK